MFAVWITGLPASGKSTLARALERELAGRGVKVAVLESDELRKVLTPRPTYSEEERDVFYGAIAYVGALLVEHGVPVIFDATANRRRHRERARARIGKLLEVLVDVPLEVCRARDPKGIYRDAASGRATTVPGLQSDYEPPERPDIVVLGLEEEPEAAARRVADAIAERFGLFGSLGSR